MKSRPCLHCGQIPLQHTANYMLCPNPEGGYLETQYAPDPNKHGAVPSYAPPELVEVGQ